MTGMVLAEIGCGDAREMVTWARKKGRTPAEVAALRGWRSGGGGR